MFGGDGVAPFNGQNTKNLKIPPDHPLSDDTKGPVGTTKPTLLLCFVGLPGAKEHCALQTLAVWILEKQYVDTTAEHFAWHIRRHASWHQIGQVVTNCSLREPDLGAQKQLQSKIKEHQLLRDSTEPLERATCGPFLQRFLFVGGIFLLGGSMTGQQ